MKIIPYNFGSHAQFICFRCFPTLFLPQWKIYFRFLNLSLPHLILSSYDACEFHKTQMLFKFKVAETGATLVATTMNIRSAA